MRKDLQSRIATVSQALKKLAGPAEMDEVASKIQRLASAISSGKVSPENLPKAKVMLVQLTNMLISLAENSQKPPAEAA